MSQFQLKIASTLGPLYLVASEEGLCGVHWQEQISPFLKDNRAVQAARHLFEAAEQIDAYLSGERQKFDVTLDLRGTAFQCEVWSRLCEIPYGQTISYRELAVRVNRPKACRAVGSANGRNPLSLIVPCHRVIASNASLGGYAGGLDRKRWLLQLETH